MFELRSYRLVVSYYVIITLLTSLPARLNLEKDYVWYRAKQRIIDALIFASDFYEESTLDVKKMSWPRKGFFWVGIIFQNEEYKEITQTW